jgi:ectoine hydroxylase-related dioxygenase (phytanoyl-CoA dioxygenase family)
MSATATVTSIEEALRKCGVTETTLTPGEKNALDRDGYLVLADVLDRERIGRLRTAFDEAVARGKRHGVHVVLPWDDPVFDGVCTHPRVLAAAHHVLGGPFKTSGVCGRNPAPGFGQQALHTDWPPRAPSEPFYLVTALWLLDDFTPANGATRVLPGSHRALRALPRPMRQPESRHKDQKVIVAQAGSALVFNGHLWHGGTRNEAGRPRRVLQGQFRARDLVLPGEISSALPERFPAATRYLLGEGCEEEGLR